MNISHTIHQQQFGERTYFRRVKASRMALRQLRLLVPAFPWMTLTIILFAYCCSSALAEMSETRSHPDAQRDVFYDDYGGRYGGNSVEVFTRRMGAVAYPPPRRTPLPPSLRQHPSSHAVHRRQLHPRQASQFASSSARRQWALANREYLYDLEAYENSPSERKKGLLGGNGAGSELLLASLPFVFAPLVGMLMAPLALPTHMAAASLLAARAGGPVVVHRGKRDLVGQQGDLEKMRQRMIARYMRCSGLLSIKNHCVEKLACDFAAFNDFKKAKRLEREVTAMLITNIFHNPHIGETFKERMRGAAKEGKKDPASCSRYRCGLDDVNLSIGGKGKSSVTHPPTNMKKSSSGGSQSHGSLRAKRRKHKHNPPSEFAVAKMPELFDF